MAGRTDLPLMPLCNGCGSCCGPVTARPAEAKRIRHFMRENDVSWQIGSSEAGAIDLACGFLRKQEDATYRCAIHPVRPWPCRAFGVIKEMECPFFPEAVVMSFPASKATLLHLVDAEDKLLGEYVEAGYLKRIGGRKTALRLQTMAVRAVREGRVTGGDSAGLEDAAPVTRATRRLDTLTHPPAAAHPAAPAIPTS